MKRLPDERVTRAARVVAALGAVAVVALFFAVAAGCTRQGTDKPVPRIGFLSSVPSAISAGLQEGLRELGYVEGRSIVVEWRWTEGKAERVPQLAAELVGLKPDLIVATSGVPTAAVKAATPMIPIVGVAIGDPVREGLVASLARPGGNLTGLGNLVSAEFTGKMLAMLHQTVPSAKRIGVLLNPSNPDHRSVASSDLPPAAGRLGLTLIPMEAKSAGEIEAAFEQVAHAKADAMLVLGDPVIYVNRARIAELAARQRLPALYFFRENAEAGGLMSYGPSLHDLGRRAATYVDKILKGASPAGLPVEQPVKFDLVINLKAAAELGLTIPPALLQQAELVIE